VLEVVEKEEGRRLTELLDLPHLGRLRNRGANESWIGDWGERHEEDAVGIRIRELGRDLKCEPRLAASARSGDRDEPSATGEQVTKLGELSFASDQCGGRDRQVRPVQAFEGRELPVPELVDPFGGRQVLQPVPAKIAQAVRANQVARRLRHEDLPAVAGGGDPRSAMHVDADVALLGEERLAGV